MTDERDLRDPALDAAWRAQSGETPPPALDAAILAAAHRAVKSAPEKIGPGREATRPWRWWTPLAAAAAIGAIAIGALQLLPQEPDATKVVVSDTPATATVRSAAAPAAQAPERVAPSSPPASPPPVAAAASQAATPTQTAPVPPAMTSPAPAKNAPRSRASVDAAAPSAAAKSAPAQAQSREEKVLAAPQAAPEPFPARRDAAAADTTRGGTANAARESDAVGRADIASAPAAPQPRVAPAPPPASAAGAIAPMLAKRAMRDEVQRQRPPDDFILRIRKLFADGNIDEAKRELVAFRAAYADADAQLPADLRPWAATVPRN